MAAVLDTGQRIRSFYFRAYWVSEVKKGESWVCNSFEFDVYPVLPGCWVLDNSSLYESCSQAWALTRPVDRNWPLIGREWSRDLDTGIWLVVSDHTTCGQELGLRRGGSFFWSQCFNSLNASSGKPLEPGHRILASHGLRVNTRPGYWQLIDRTHSLPAWWKL